MIALASWKLRLHALLVLAFLASGLPAAAQTFSVLHHFEASPGIPNARPTLGADGNFYGTTRDRGGSAYKVTPAGAMTILHRFTAAEGGYPVGLVQAPDGNFYGPAQGGGVDGRGSIFRLTPAGDVTPLHFFSGDDGSTPTVPPTVGNDGALYGVTYTGGLYGNGTAFRMTLAGDFQKLHDFSSTEGRYASALLLVSDGNFYGTTSYEGGGTETVFRMTPAGAVTVLYTLSAWPNQIPAYPSELVEGLDGALYGTTEYGGGGGYGSIFRITTSGTLTTLVSFYYGGPSTPRGGVTLGSDGTFYGATLLGGLYDSGVVYRMSSGGDFEPLHSFSGADGSAPPGRPIEGPGGDLYDTTMYGPAGSRGTFFRISKAGAFSTLALFATGEGTVPLAGLLLASDGMFYGTTARGGMFDYGTIFTISPGGAFAPLRSFLGADGAGPRGTLTEGAGGVLFGVTRDGGTTGWGTLFSATSAGALSSLHSFAFTDGADPIAGLLKAPDGNFYGTTSHGGGASKGTVFRMTPAGAVTTLYSFSGADGNSPAAALTLGADGDLYGTTLYGGSAGLGTAFRITTGGSLTTLYSFTAPTEAAPNGLTLGQDGNFYGTTYGTYAAGCEVFRMTPAGAVTAIYTFPPPSLFPPNCPTGPLLQLASGAFFGSTNGTLFSITPAGALTTLHTFSGPDGTSAAGSPVADANGVLYGTTSSGGRGDAGVVYRLDPSGPPEAHAILGGDGTSCLGSAANLQVQLTGAPPWTLTWSDGFVQTGIVASPATRAVAPQFATIYTLKAASDANGPGLVSGSATVRITQPLSALTISPATPVAICSTGYRNFGASTVGGGASIAYQWGYRTTPGGPITPMPGINLGYTSIPASAFPSAGTYGLVVTATPSCGAAMVSDEVEVTVLPPLGLPVISAPSVAPPSATGLVASVAQHPGSTYNWLLTGGTITAGNGTSQITFSVFGGGVAQLQVYEMDAGGCFSQTAFATISIAAATSFFPISPCRQVDTRIAGGPILAGTIRAATLTGGACSIPSTAVSVSANVTVTQQTADGELSIYPASQAPPGTTTVAFTQGNTRAGNAILFLSPPGQDVALFNRSAGALHVVIDVNGYFQ